MALYINYTFLKQGEVIQIEEELDRILKENKFPCIVAFGESIESICEYRVCVEGCIIKVPTMSKCVLAWFGAFWMFNITYTASCKSIIVVYK